MKVHIVICNISVEFDQVATMLLMVKDQVLIEFKKLERIKYILISMEISPIY